MSVSIYFVWAVSFKLLSELALSRRLLLEDAFLRPGVPLLTDTPVLLVFGFTAALIIWLHDIEQLLAATISFYLKFSLLSPAGTFLLRCGRSMTVCRRDLNTDTILEETRLARTDDTFQMCLLFLVNYFYVGARTVHF